LRGDILDIFELIESELENFENLHDIIKRKLRTLEEFNAIYTRRTYDPDSGPRTESMLKPSKAIPKHQRQHLYFKQGKGKYFVC